MVQHARFFRHWRSLRHKAALYDLTWTSRSFDNLIHFLLPLSPSCECWTNYGLNIARDRMKTQPWTFNAFSTTRFTVDFTIECWIFSFLICQNKWLENVHTKLSWKLLSGVSSSRCKAHQKPLPQTTEVINNSACVTLYSFNQSSRAVEEICWLLLWSGSFLIPFWSPHNTGGMCNYLWIGETTSINHNHKSRIVWASTLFAKCFC